MLNTGDVAKEFEERGADVSKHGKFIDFVNNTFRYMKIGDHEIIQTPNGELVEHVLMDEEYFVENWLTQFAIGRVNGKNYFDLAGWSGLTEGFTKGVVILNENKELVFIIRKFTDMALNWKAREYMTMSCKAGSQAHGAPSEELRDEIIQKLAYNIKGTLGEHKDDDTSITGLVPRQYYLDKGVHPETLQQLIYIRDVFTYANQPIDPEGDIMKRLERVLRKWNDEYIVSDADKAFVSDVTQGTFNFDKPGHLVVEDIQKQEPVKQEPEGDFDPLG